MTKGHLINKQPLVFHTFYLWEPILGVLVSGVTSIPIPKLNLFVLVQKLAIVPSVYPSFIFPSQVPLVGCRTYFLTRFNVHVNGVICGDMNGWQVLVAIEPCIIVLPAVNILRHQVNLILEGFGFAICFSILDVMRCLIVWTTHLWYVCLGRLLCGNSLVRLIF